MRSFQTFFNQTKDFINSTVIEGIAAPIYGYASLCNSLNDSKAISSGAQAVWNSCPVQSAIEGFTAPINGYVSLCNALNESKELNTAFTNAKWLNGKYAAQGLIAQMHYKYVVHGNLTAFAETYNSKILTYGLLGVEYLDYGVMHFFLLRELVRNLTKNCSYLRTITTSATEIMPQSPHFPPADSKKEQVLSVIGSSTLVYTVDRNLTEFASFVIKLCFPGITGHAFSFLLESVVYGFLLIDFKLGAAGLSNKGFIKKWQDNLPYIICYGASFVFAKTLLDSSSAIFFGSAYNYYSYDAIFSFLFDIFVIMSISRTKALPGDNQVSIDIWALIKPYVDTPAMRNLLNIILAELRSLDHFAKSEAGSQLFRVHEPQIKNGLNIAKEGVKKVEDIQYGKLVTTAKWLNYVLPGILPRDELDKLINQTKETLSHMIERMEELLEVSKTADGAPAKPKEKIIEINGNEIKKSLEENKIVLPGERQVILFPPKKEKVRKDLPQIIPMKAQEVKDSERLITVPLVTKSILLEVPKTLENPSPESKDDNVPIGLQKPMIEENYFGNAPKPEIQPADRLSFGRSENAVTLFARPVSIEPHQKKPDSRVMTTASIISNVARKKS